MLTVGEYTETFDLTVSVTPYPIITIYDFYQTEDLGFISSKEPLFSITTVGYFAEDETGTFEFDLWDFDFKVEIGWEVVIKYDDYNYDYYTIELLRFINQQSTSGSFETYRSGFIGTRNRFQLFISRPICGIAGILLLPV